MTEAHIFQNNDPFTVNIVIGEKTADYQTRYRDFTAKWDYIDVDSGHEIPPEAILTLDRREAEALFDAVHAHRPDVTSELRARLKVAEDRLDLVLSTFLKEGLDG